MLVEGIIEEAELIAMNQAEIEVFGKLLNDLLAYRVLEFFDKFENSDMKNREDERSLLIHSRYLMFKNILEHKIKILTFPKEVKDKGVFEMLKGIDMMNIPNIETEKRLEYIDKLSWLISNRRYWSATVPTRDRDTFNEFLDMAKNDWGIRVLAKRIEFKDNIGHVENLVEALKQNKEMFFERNEKPRYTGLGSIMSMSSILEIALHGLKYRQYCQENNVVKYTTRSYIV